MAHDELDFEKIHEEFRPKIHRYLVRLVGEQEADDLTQDVFIKISRALNSFRGESQLSTWIYRIATNAALDRLRNPSFQETTKLFSSAELDIKNEIEVGDQNVWTGGKAPLVEQQIFRQEMSECIQGFLKQLPEKYRTTLVLSEFEGLSNAEIAEILGISLETVKIRLHRGREKLKEELAANCDSYWVEDNPFLPELKRE